MLLAPDGEPSVLDVLAFENTVNAAIKCLFRLLALGVGAEDEVWFSFKDVPQNRHDTRHSGIVERDPSAIIVLQGISLRPTSIGILRGETVLECSIKGCPIV